MAIDEYARVRRAAGGLIANCFAAGETTGGLHGRDRLGGTGMMETFVFGRLAGAGAAMAGRRFSSV